MIINHIYIENCLETMQKMTDSYIDFVITLSPYYEILDYKGYKFQNRTETPWT